MNTISTDGDISPKNDKLDSDDNIPEIHSPQFTNAKPSSSNTFHLLSLLPVWTDPGTTAKHTTVAIILPSGFCARELTVRLIEDGDEFELVVDLPKPLVDISYMQKKWLIMDYSLFTHFNPK